MQLIFLAAGRGSRLPKRNRNKPKCLTKIRNKTIFEHNIKFFEKFKKKIIITGYKKKFISYIAKKNSFETVLNKKYKNTNMVYSMFLARKKIDEDVVICYGDIIFNEKIYKTLQKKNDFLPLNKNWKKYWLSRMSFSKMMLDAENIEINKNYIKEIGTSLKFNKLPRYQFMGIIKLKKKTYLRLFKFFRKIKKPKIDMTSFLNKAIKNKFIKLGYLEYKSYWFEIDSANDITSANKMI